MCDVERNEDIADMIMPGQIWRVGMSASTAAAVKITSLRSYVHKLDNDVEMNDLCIIVCEDGRRAHSYTLTVRGAAWCCLTPTIDERIDR